MTSSSNRDGDAARPKRVASSGRHSEVQLEHYLRLILHRWWLVAGTFVLVGGLTVAITSRMPDIFTSYTLILVDPQKVPENYVKPTVTGDVRNRLGTLSQQILSSTRLQKIIDALNLYPEERKTMAREDVTMKMRSDINVNLVSDYGGSQQDLQAFRITYSGKDPRLVAQVTNQIASLFIEENLKVREQQASGTTEFLGNQLQETRKTLETQEAKLRDFKLKHIGEMPEQQAADLQILGQVQSQLQLESETLSRAEQQRTYLQSMMAQGAPVVELDDPEQKAAPPAKEPGKAPVNAVESNKARLAALLARGYTDRHPDVQRLKKQIEQDEARPVADAPAKTVASEQRAAEDTGGVARTVKVRQSAPVPYVNPVLQSQLQGVEAEIAKHKQEVERLRGLVASYHSKLEAIPIREQEVTQLVRDYEISKAHYSQLLDKQLSAETATQLELRQKGEKFSVLDTAQAAERPSRPNRFLLNSVGCVCGLALGLLLALITEMLGVSITAPEQISEGCGIPVLEVIPNILTRADRVIRKKRLILAAASGVLVMALAVGAILIYHYRNQTF